MRVGIGQLNPAIGDIDGNVAKIIASVEEARSAGCALVVFPELAIPGPAPLDLVRRSAFVEGCAAGAERLRAASAGITVVAGTLAREAGSAGEELRNCAMVFSDREPVACIGKTAISRGSREAGYFHPARGLETVRIAGRSFGITLGEALDRESIDVLTELGAEWVVHLATSPYRVGIREERRAAARRAIEDGTGVLFVNTVGGFAGTVYDGGSFAISPAGLAIAEGPDFEEGLTTFDLDAEESESRSGARELDRTRKAIVLGIGDFVRKTGFERVVLGVSGGIDSALVAALAVEALGPEAVIGTFIPCAASSERSRDDARTLASNLGFELIEIPATNVHQALREALPFEPGGIVDENLQARARAVLWMALANERNALVLAAGNKSEAAVGYATLYGDTTGALAPIADLYKEDVYRLADSFGDRIPQSIMERAPSAELRLGQADADDLPPYDVLDRILRGLIDENLSREELVNRGFETQIVDDILRRFHASEFKRRQAPPGIAVTTTPLGARNIPLANAFRD